MKKTSKHKIWLLLLILPLGLALTGCYEGMSKEQMISLVQAHHAEIEAGIRHGDAEAMQKKWGVREVRILEDGHVEFFCAGAGIGSGTAYFGFYFSPDDQPFDICSWAGDITPQENGWAWQEENGDNTFYTERILDRFFYYAYSF